MNKTTIVITTIFPPTKAVLDFSKLPDYNLIVIGDKKTPLSWSTKGVVYLSIEEQLSSGFKLVNSLPYNHYSRKMIGYLEAMKMGANFIIDTDDDNLPKEKWGFPEFYGEYSTIESGMGFINIYQLFTAQSIWPRGLPLNLINKKFKLENYLSRQFSKIGVWQGLADGDPDVDAIYRLTNDAECVFENREPVVLDKGSIAPFNSQNTCITRDLFPLLYLPTFVSFRFTDILRGLVAQPIMWKYGFKLGFIKATVTQVRNPHDYLADFISEIPMYVHGEKVIRIVEKTISEKLTISENLLSAYKALEHEGIVQKEEINTLILWLNDIEDMKLL